MLVSDKPHSRADLLADIESGIRSTGDTNIGSAVRYQARAALRELEEQVSAYEDEINERTSDQALTLRKLREEQEKNAALEEQFEALREAATSALDVLHDPTQTWLPAAELLSVALTSNPAERSDD